MVYETKSSRKRRIVTGTLLALVGIGLLGVVASVNEHETKAPVQVVPDIKPDKKVPEFTIGAQDSWKDFACTRHDNIYAEWPKAKAYLLDTRGTKTLWGVTTPEMGGHLHKLVSDSSNAEKCGFIKK